MSDKSKALDTAILQLEKNTAPAPLCVSEIIMRLMSKLFRQAR